MSSGSISASGSALPEPPPGGSATGQQMALPPPPGGQFTSPSGWTFSENDFKVMVERMLRDDAAAKAAAAAAAAPRPSGARGPSGVRGPSAAVVLPESTVIKNSLIAIQNTVDSIKKVIDPFFTDETEEKEIVPAKPWTYGPKKGQIRYKAKMGQVPIPNSSRFAKMVDESPVKLEEVKTILNERLPAPPPPEVPQEGGRRSRSKTLKKRKRMRRTRRT